MIVVDGGAAFQSVHFASFRLEYPGEKLSLSARQQPPVSSHSNAGRVGFDPTIPFGFV